MIAVNKAIMGREIFSDTQNKLVDVDGNGTVDSNDALLMLKRIVGLIDSFD